MAAALLKAERFNNAALWLTGETSRKLPEVREVSFILDSY